MKLIGLTGGIASGKSTVARRLAEHGAVVIDADQLARDVVTPGSSSLTKICEAFGRQVQKEDGTLDREALAAIVFAEPARRELLESIIHPAVQVEFARLVQAAVAADARAVVVYDVPLLVETSSDYPYDLVVTVQAGREAQIDRMVNLRGYDREDASARLSAQATDEERAARADVVIDSSQSLADTMSQVDALWMQIRELPESSVAL